MGGVEGGLCTKGGYLPGSDHGSLGSLGGGGMATCGCGRCRDMAAYGCSLQDAANKLAVCISDSEEGSGC